MSFLFCMPVLACGSVWSVIHRLVFLYFLLLASMAIVPCFGCDLVFSDIYSFRNHLDTNHKNVTTYMCQVTECYRNFPTYKSFRSHLVNKHQIPANAKEAQNTTLSLGINVGAGTSDDGAVSLGHSTETNVCDISKSSPVSSADVKQMLLFQQDKFVAKLYSNPSLPRNLVDTMVHEFSDFLTSSFFEKLRLSVVSSLDPNLPVESKKEITDMFDVIMNPFEHLRSEYKRFQYFQELGEFIPPRSYDICKREERARGDGATLTMKSVTGVYIPLREVFTKFFYLPHALEDTLSYMASLSSRDNWFCNVTQGSVWQRKIARFKLDDIVLPLVLYYDDLEPNEPLGAHCEPLGCSYVQIASLPPEYSSTLENIFLALLFDADNRSVYGNRKVFQPLLDELHFLETEGIDIQTNEKGKVKLYLVVALIIGDNKALNEICGFVASFSANYFCRTCKVYKADSEHMCTEDESLIRTPETYAADVLLEDPSSTGIKEECIFNDLPSFSAPIDIGLDEFHDLSEGVAHYTMVPVLRHFDELNDQFISTLNGRLYSYDYGVDNDNRPPLINRDKLRSSNSLKMTGAEMNLFVRVFGVLVHDMVPEDDPYFKLYLLLNDIMSIGHAKALPKEAAKILEVKVSEHNKLWLELTKDTLKPKHHFLFHYARFLAMFGPFGVLSTIRFEAKHRLLKLTANTCISRVNLPKTIAIKQQLAFCHRVVSNASIRKPVITGPSHVINLKDMPFFNSFSHSLPDSVLCTPTQSVYNWVEYKGTKYKPKQILLTDSDDSKMFIFAEIQIIILVDGEPFFICSGLDTVGYFSRVRGYEVSRSPAKAWSCTPQSRLLDPYPLALYPMASGEIVVLPKYVL